MPDVTSVAGQILPDLLEDDRSDFFTGEAALLRLPRRDGPAQLMSLSGLGVEQSDGSTAWHHAATKFKIADSRLGAQS
jgi:hypothetical protein